MTKKEKIFGGKILKKVVQKFLRRKCGVKEQERGAICQIWKAKNF